MKLRILKVHDAWNMVHDVFRVGDIVEYAKNSQTVTTASGHTFKIKDLCKVYSNRCKISDILEKVVEVYGVYLTELQNMEFSKYLQRPEVPAPNTLTNEGRFLLVIKWLKGRAKTGSPEQKSDAIRSYYEGLSLAIEKGYTSVEPYKKESRAFRVGKADASIFGENNEQVS